MNALTVAAALSPLVLVYQGGHLTGLLGYTPNGGVEPSDFLVTAAIVFALSTDYGVFLLGRIKEARDSGLGDREAVATGLARTGRVVTAVAILLAVAICAFSTGSISFIQQIGVATATGVLIDAFVVRTLLVPSLMALLGRWNWWAPRRLRHLHGRLPALERERSRSPSSPRATRRARPRTPERGRCSRAYDERRRGRRNATVAAWLPVVVLPPLLVLDAALTSDGPRVTVLGLLAAVVGCLPLVLRRRLRFALLAPLTAGIVLTLWRLEPGNTVVLIAMVALVELAARGDRRRTPWRGLAVVPCVLVSVVPFAARRRRRNLTATITPSSPNETPVTDAPARPSIRLNAVVTRTPSSSACR